MIGKATAASVRSLMILTLLSTFGAAPAMAQTGPNQPRMYEALNALLAARSALESGATNKGGYRLRALAEINRAIRDTRAGIDYAN